MQRSLTRKRIHYFSGDLNRIAGADHYEHAGTAMKLKIRPLGVVWMKRGNSVEDNVLGLLEHFFRSPFADFLAFDFIALPACTLRLTFTAALEIGSDIESLDDALILGSGRFAQGEQPPVIRGCVSRQIGLIDVSDSTGPFEFSATCDTDGLQFFRDAAGTQFEI